MSEMENRPQEEKKEKPGSPSVDTPPPEARPPVEGQTPEQVQAVDENADINFDCPHCRQNLDLPPDMKGWIIDCPVCGNTFKAPTLTEAARKEEEGESGQEGIEEVADGRDVQGSKSSTVRIDLPKEEGQLQPRKRIVKVKRI